MADYSNEFHRHRSALARQIVEVREGLVFLQDHADRGLWLLLIDDARRVLADVGQAVCTATALATLGDVGEREQARKAKEKVGNG